MSERDEYEKQRPGWISVKVRLPNPNPVLGHFTNSAGTSRVTWTTTKKATCTTGPRAGTSGTTRTTRTG